MNFAFASIYNIIGIPIGNECTHVIKGRSWIGLEPLKHALLSNKILLMFFYILFKILTAHYEV